MTESSAHPAWSFAEPGAAQPSWRAESAAGFGKMERPREPSAPVREGLIGHEGQTTSGSALKHSNKVLKGLLVEHLDALRRFCFSLTGSAADGDDLAQGTVELLLEKGVPADAPFLPWMFRVCKNHWIDGLRSRSRTRTATADELERHQDAHDGQADAFHRIQVGELQRAVEQLDADQRLVLGLVSVQGFSYREAAEILDIPIGTVMSRLSRARKRLLELTEENK
ncbi:RNA polymerase sigma factor [Wenzhouxiangella marina]|uniref:RNA polymerase sigma 70 n=1 Tax=Wenzhouxiangella marina TaxID=1579979 RepID=A0A0K0XU14_9GAMM|nr:RNA polymerase sigma factor [Wenzhouxiangella marina]AKS41117.1 RNA polymerase sigma 70 [Wenzhouxiangella marina]